MIGDLARERCLTKPCSVPRHFDNRKRVKKKATSLMECGLLIVNRMN